MKNATKLLRDLSVVSFAATTVYFVPVLIVLILHLSLTSRGEEITGMVMAFVPSALGAYLLYRRLRSRYSNRPALWTSLTFAVSAPVSLLVGIVLAPFPGGYADILMGGPFALFGAFVGIMVVVTILTFGPSWFSLWLSMRTLTGANE